MEEYSWEGDAPAEPLRVACATLDPRVGDKVEFPHHISLGRKDAVAHLMLRRLGRSLALPDAFSLPVKRDAETDGISVELNTVVR